MNAALRELYRAKDLVGKAEAATYYNQTVKDAAGQKKEPIRKASEKIVKGKERNCKLLAGTHRFFTRTLPVLLILSAAIALFVYLAENTFAEQLFLDFDSFVGEAREYAIENVSDFPTLLMNANTKRYSEAERISYFKSEYFEADCFTFLTGSVMWMTLFIAIVCAMFEKKVVSPLAVLLDVLLIVYMIIKLVIQQKTIIGVVVGVPWMSISGIPLMWSRGLPIMIAFAVVNAIITVGFSVISSLKIKHGKTVVPNLTAIKAWKEEIAAEKAACNQKCAKIDKAYDGLMLAYPEGYSKLRPFLRDYDTVQQLIWTIEQGYAKDIEGARVFLDQKAENAKLRRQLEVLQRETRAAKEAARRAEAAAREPVDVNITVW